MAMDYRLSDGMQVEVFATAVTKASSEASMDGEMPTVPGPDVM